MTKKVGQKIPKRFRNDGYSLGLEHPFIYGHDKKNWIVWHRHTGVIKFVSAGHSWRDESKAERKCYELNHLDVDSPTDLQVLASIDHTP